MIYHYIFHYESTVSLFREWIKQSGAAIKPLLINQLSFPGEISEKIVQYYKKIV